MLIAIDPGVKGGIVIRHSDEKTKGYKMPINIERFFNSIPGLSRYKVYIENVTGYFGKNLPSSRIGVLCENYGYLKGFLEASGATVNTVRPQKWMKMLGMKREKWETKTRWKWRLKEEAVFRFPNNKKEITLATADAFLILKYGMIQEGIFT